MKKLFALCVCWLVAGVGQAATPLNEMLSLPSAQAGRTVSLSGYTSQSDGGGGMFSIIADDGRSVDSGTVFRSTVRTNLLFVRQVEGPYYAAWFGALGDGSDATAALTNAIRWASARGKELILVGTNVISSTLTISSNSDLTISGNASINSYNNPGTIIRLADGADCDMLVKSANARLNLKRLYFDGNRANQSLTNLAGIRFTGASDTSKCVLENLVVVNVSGDGIYNEARETRIYWSTISHNLHRGVVNTASSDVILMGLLYGFNGSHGLVLDGATGVGANAVSVIEGNVYRNGGCGVLLTNASFCKFSHVKIDVNNQHGVLLSGTSLRNRFTQCDIVCNNYPTLPDGSPTTFASGSYDNFRIDSSCPNEVILSLTDNNLYEYESTLTHKPGYLLNDLRTGTNTMRSVSLSGSAFTAGSYWVTGIYPDAAYTNALGTWFLDGEPTHRKVEYLDSQITSKLRAFDQVSVDVGVQINASYTNRTGVSRWEYLRDGPAYYIKARYDDTLLSLQFAPSGTAGDEITWDNGLTIDSATGNVGVNTGATPATDQLQVAGWTRAETLESGDTLVFNAYYDSGWLYRTTGYAYRIQAQGSYSNIVFWVAPSGVAGSPVSWQQVMTMQQDGSVTFAADGEFTGNVSANGMTVNTVNTSLLQLTNVTASRFLVTDANGYVTNTVAATGTGAPVLQESPTISGTLTILTNAVIGAGAGAAQTNPASSTYGNGLSIYDTSSSDPYIRLHRDDGVVGLDLWSDSSTGQAYFDHQHNSDTSGFLFRRKIRSGSPVLDFGLVGTNASFYNAWQINSKFIGQTNKWKLMHGQSTHPTFQANSTNSATRLYVIPNGTVASGLASGIKLFGTDFESSMTDYDDFGLLNMTDGNYINVKTNGTSTLKNIYFTKQDDQVVGWFDLTNMVFHTRTLRVTNGITAGISTGTPVTPSGSSFGTGISVNSTGSTDAYFYLARGDELVGSAYWVDNSTGNVFLDHFHDSDATGFQFRTKVRGTPRTMVTMIGTNVNVPVQLNASALNSTNGLVLGKTVTAGGSTGNQVINKPSGSVNFAAAAQLITVTCNLVDANSIIIATVATDDDTAFACKAIPGSGSFVLKLNAAATAETRVNFLVTN